MNYIQYGQLTVDYARYLLMRKVWFLLNEGKELDRKFLVDYYKEKVNLIYELLDKQPQLQNDALTESFVAYLIEEAKAKYDPNYNNE